MKKHLLSILIAAFALFASNAFASVSISYGGAPNSVSCTNSSSGTNLSVKCTASSGFIISNAYLSGGVSKSWTPNVSSYTFSVGGLSSTGSYTLSVITTAQGAGTSSSSTTRSSSSVTSVSYTITYNTNGGTISGSAITSYTSATSTFSLPTPTRDGYVFDGWYTSSSFSGSAVTQITKGSTGDKTFYAKWRIDVTLKKPTLVDGCYEITYAGELFGFAAIVNGTDGMDREANVCGILKNDIVVNENVLNADGSLNGDGSNFKAWTPIGTTTSKPFDGTFDGQGHKISGLYYDNSNQNYVGLFGYVSNSGKTVTISDVGVVDSYLHGRNNVGGLVGSTAFKSPLTVSNSYSASTVTGSEYVGGLVGHSEFSLTVSNSYSASTVTGVNRVGGFVGDAFSSLSVSNSYSASTVTGETYVGGLVGYASSSLSVSNSYNKGFVKATGSHGWAGGLASSVGVGGSSSIINSYNVGKVEGISTDDFVSSGSPTITNSFYIGSSGKGGSKATEEQFKNGSVALSLYFYDDGGTIWGQNVGVDDYPDFSGEVKNASVSISTITFHTFGENFFEKQYVEGLKYPLPKSVEREGFTFKGWYDNESFSGGAVTAIAAAETGAKAYYARWDKVMTNSTPESDFNKDDYGCYEIATVENLYGFAAIVNGGNKAACGILTADIVVNENVLDKDGNLTAGEFFEWNPIGTSSNPFGGSFDGQGHKISGLYYNNSNQYYVGLFGYVKNSGKTVTISDVGVEDSFLHGCYYVGGLVGYASSSLSVSNFYSTSKVTGHYYVGGLVGHSESSLTVSNSYSASTVTGVSYVGGLVGYASSSLSVSNSYNQGNVKVTSYSGWAGGFAGRVGSSSTITNSYNTGSVEPKDEFVYPKDDFVYSGLPTIANSFYIGSSSKGGTMATEEQFKNHTVAIQLHSWCEKDEDGENCKEGGLNGSVWGQDVDDLFPTIAFDGVGVVKYKIHVELGGGFIEGDKDFVVRTLGSVTTLPIPTRYGYAFAGWYDNENFTGDAVIAIAADETGAKTFYAKWDLVEYAISYNLNGGVNSELNPLSYNVESAATTLAEPSRDGCIFAGWYDNENFTGDAVTEIAAGSIGEKTFYAKWIQTVFGAITIAADRSSAIIDGNSSATTDIPAPIVVNEVVMKRNFNAMVPSTIVLPFDFAYDEDHADRVNARFYRIGQVYRHESAWKVDMIRTYDLHAGTPYSVIVEDTKLNFDFNGEPVTIKTPEENLVQGSTNITGEKVVGDWSFVGTYTYKAWGEDDYKEPFYGYATKKDAQGNVIRDENGIGKGVFGSIVSGNYILPMRAYLERHVFLENGPKRAPSLFKTSAVNDDVPESLEISFIDGDGQTTAIGHFNTRTGEFKVDRWFDMKGRKLDHKPTTKGIYFNNNKRVIIK